MNIAIVGAGSIGVATAHALAQAGHEVTVYERHGTAAEEASFGHAGWLGPSLLQPWSVPGLSTAERSPTLPGRQARSEEHTSELQSHSDLVCRLLLEKKNTLTTHDHVRSPSWLTLS